MSTIHHSLHVKHVSFDVRNFDIFTVSFYLAEYCFYCIYFRIFTVTIYINSLTTIVIKKVMLCHCASFRAPDV